MDYLKKLFVTQGLITAAAAIIYTLLPEARPLFILENSLIETLSAAMFLLAFIVSLYYRKNSRIYFIPAAIGLLSFLDEISFGEQIFNIQMPLVRGMKIDSLHDLIQLAWTMLSEPTIKSVLALAAAAIIGIAAIIYIRKRVAISDVLAFFKPANRIGFCILWFFILGFSATIIDIGFENQKFIEEMLEFNAAIAMLFAAFGLRRGGQAGA